MNENCVKIAEEYRTVTNNDLIKSYLYSQVLVLVYVVTLSTFTIAGLIALQCFICEVFPSAVIHSCPLKDLVKCKVAHLF